MPPAKAHMHASYSEGWQRAQFDRFCALHAGPVLDIAVKYDKIHLGLPRVCGAGLSTILAVAITAICPVFTAKRGNDRLGDKHAFVAWGGRRTAWKKASDVT